jgi:subtilisin-like proprotein convertase family protein
MSEARSRRMSALSRFAGSARASRHAAAALVEALEDRRLLSITDQILWRGEQVEMMTGSWIVTFANELTALAQQDLLNDVIDRLGVDVHAARSLGRGYAQFTTTTRFSEASVDRVKADLASVVQIQPDRIYQPADVTPNDPLFSQIWGLNNTGQFVQGFGPGTPGADISAPEAWQILQDAGLPIGSTSVAIAVVDSGVDLDHPDLLQNIWSNPGEVPDNGIDDDNNGFVDDWRGWDFGDFDNNPDDDSSAFGDWLGHGTACAGVISAFGNNSVGVTGVGWNLQIVPVKIASRFGFASTSSIVGAHNYLATLLNQGYNIVASNNSYGAPGAAFYEDPPPDLFTAEQAAIQSFIDAGGTFVASAGNAAYNNDDPTIKFYPASYDLPGLIAVAATDPNDALANFSNYGARTVDIAAPGVQYLTTAVGGGYSYFGGTSCAGPIVAGAVGLLKTLQPDASATEIRQALINSADPLPSLQGRLVSGGRLNIAEALRIIGIEGPVVRSIDPGPIVPPSVDDISVTFSEAVNPALVSTSSVSLIASGGDGIFGNGNDVVQTINAVSFSEGDTILTITPGAALGAEVYRLILDEATFRDPQGNHLNGNTTSGDDEVYTFQVRSLSNTLESNDTLDTATFVNFNIAGTALFTGMTLGDGLYGNLDVDIYRVEMSRGGLITARIDAKSLPTPSTLDSHVRLFDADGDELTSNDQFNGADSFLDFFVTTGGTYYIGVSGFPNSRYNPLVASSGATQSRGTYNLSLTVDLVADDQRVFSSALPLPVDIPDSSQYANFLEVDDDRLVLDVNVTISIDHDFVGDIVARLISPGGTSVTLINRRGGSGDFQADPNSPVPALFDDEATSTITLAVPPFSGGTFRPDQALSAIDGESALGTWQLVVEDQGPLNTGQFISWSLSLTLQNNIFGPFELNDTLTTARDLNEISGSGAGAATRAGVLGDGGFGVFDVDLFRFTADAGSTLNVTAFSGGSANTALRLFDAAGTEIKVSNPTGELNSSITALVLASGGTYYIGVSETTAAEGEGAYDATRAGSGAAALTTGSYTLTVQVTAGVSDGGVVLSGDLLNVGVTSTGTFGQSGSGLRFGGTEFLFGGTSTFAEAFFGLVASGANFLNDGPLLNPDLPFSTIVQGDALNRRIVAQGLFRGLQIERSISFGAGDSFFVIDINLTNITQFAFADVSWMEALNPEQGRNLAPSSSSTSNDVLDGSPFVSGRYINNTFTEGLSIALGAPQSDSRASATVFDPTTVSVRDPEQILSLGINDPDGLSGDMMLALAFNIGVMNPGDSQSLRYFVFFGNTLSAVEDAYADLNAGVGVGHLTVDPATPADDADGIAALPYLLYYPEGFANARSSTFVPVVNPNDQDARVVIIARYASGDRDSILFDGTVEANTRSGLTITTPALYADGDQLVRQKAPYAIEVRSSLPVSATMSHFDFGVSTGESFTSTTSDSWTFAQVTRGNGYFDFIVFYNPTDEDVKVDLTLFGDDIVIERTLTIAARRRGGWNLRQDPAIPVGTYGALITAFRPIVAAVSSYNTQLGGGYGALALDGTGSTRGVLPEGQFGLASTNEVVQILNVNNASANVTITFAFANGSAYRHVQNVLPRSRVGLDVASLPSFPTGQPYAISYESNVPVSLSLATFAFDEGEGSAFAQRANSLWAYGDGFRPAGNTGQVTEYLKIYNPADDDVLIEIELRFNDGASELFRRVASSRRVTEFNVHDFVQGERTQTRQFYGITVKSATPVVAYIGRSDNFFGGAFGSLMAPLGLNGSIS